MVCRYCGKLATGRIFDQTKGNKFFVFRLGVGEVIRGWDKGIEGMRVGDKRKLTVSILSSSPLASPSMPCCTAIVSGTYFDKFPCIIYSHITSYGSFVFDCMSDWRQCGVL